MLLFIFKPMNIYYNRYDNISSAKLMVYFIGDVKCQSVYVW